MTTLTIGRRSDCHIVVDDPTVSRMHAELTPAGGGRFTLRDADSAGGTFLRDGQLWRRVTKTTVSLGDTLRLGNHDISVADLIGRLKDASLSIEPDAPAREKPAAPAKSNSKAKFERDPLTGQIVERR